MAENSEKNLWAAVVLQSVVDAGGAWFKLTDKKDMQKKFLQLKESFSESESQIVMPKNHYERIETEFSRRQILGKCSHLSLILNMIGQDAEPFFEKFIPLVMLVEKYEQELCDIIKQRNRFLVAA